MEDGLTTALDGVRVLDLTHHIAGPYCTKLLADFGAEVTKVERPRTGDPQRTFGPFAGDDPHPDKSLSFLYLNTNKRSITLDLKSGTGRSLLRRLADRADILVENYRPRTLPAMGLSYEDLSRDDPSLVMVSISNFGQTGPYRDYEATDIVEYALGGVQYIFGSNDREPLKHAFNQAQYKAGTDAASAALIAYFHRLMTGQGQWVDVSIQECIASGLRDATSAFTYTGAVKWRQPRESGEMPRSPVRTSDGYVVPIAFGGADWSTMTDFLESDELASERFSTPESRIENAPDLDRVISETFVGRDKFDLFYRANQRRGLIYGVVQDASEVHKNTQYKHREYFRQVSHPVAGSADYPGPPFKLEGTPWKLKSPAPMLGEHNEQVYCDDLGLSPDTLATLSASGVV